MTMDKLILLLYMVGSLCFFLGSFFAYRRLP
jgi:hypothetical protein